MIYDRMELIKTFRCNKIVHSVKYICLKYNNTLFFLKEYTPATWIYALSCHCKIIIWPSYTVKLKNEITYNTSNIIPSSWGNHYLTFHIIARVSYTFKQKMEITYSYFNIISLYLRDHFTLWFISSNMSEISLGGLSANRALKISKSWPFVLYIQV